MESLVALGVITLITVLKISVLIMEAGAIGALQSHPVGSGIYLRTKCIFGKNPRDVIDRNSGIIRNLA